MSKTIRTQIKGRLRGLRQRLGGVAPHPQWVQVEINNTCNLDCVMCPRAAMTRPLCHMSMDEFREIADKVHAASVPRIRLFLLGEPLLHHELVPMIKYAKQIGIPSVEINTNGVLLDAEWSQGLIAAGLDEIVFSLDGADPEVFERVRRGANYEEVTGNIRRFFEIRKQMNAASPVGVIQTIIMRPTRDQMQQFVSMWTPVADQVRVQAIREYHGVEGLSLFHVSPDDELRPCPALWSHLVILADLRVVPCCTDINGDLALGEITEGDISYFWRRNRRLNELRRLHCGLRFAEVPLCRDCEFTSLNVLRRKAEATAEYQNSAAPPSEESL